MPTLRLSTQQVFLSLEWEQKLPSEAWLVCSPWLELDEALLANGTCFVILQHANRAFVWQAFEAANGEFFRAVEIKPEPNVPWLRAFDENLNDITGEIK